MLGCQKPCAANAPSSPEKHVHVLTMKGRSQNAQYSGNSLKIDPGNAFREPLTRVSGTSLVEMRTRGDVHITPSTDKCQNVRCSNSCVAKAQMLKLSLVLEWAFWPPGRFYRAYRFIL